MEKRYIDPMRLKMSIVSNENKTLEEIIDDEPTVAVVSKALFDQIKWERDVAIAQLEELGICFGEKIDGVYLDKREYAKLVEYRWKYKNLIT